MTDPVDKVAEALMAHLFIPCNHASIGSEDHCRCGARPRGQMEWTQHAAQAVIDALGFTGITEFERLMLVDLLRITREQAEKVKSGGWW